MILQYLLPYCLTAYLLYSAYRQVLYLASFVATDSFHEWAEATYRRTSERAPVARGFLSFPGFMVRGQSMYSAILFWRTSPSSPLRSSIMKKLSLYKEYPRKSSSNLVLSKLRWYSRKCKWFLKKNHIWERKDLAKKIAKKDACFGTGILCFLCFKLSKSIRAIFHEDYFRICWQGKCQTRTHSRTG